MSVIGSNVLAGASGSAAAGYEITRSLRFNSADSAYLNRTPSSAGNRKTWTWSGWVKRCAFGSVDNCLFSAYGNGTQSAGIYFSNDIQNDSLEVRFGPYSAGWQGFLVTAQVFRDPSAWYHIVFAADTTQATASDRLKLYINGLQVTTFNSSAYPSLNADGFLNQAQEHQIGRLQGNTYYHNGYLADIYFIDGQALAPTDFGEYDDNNVWQPIEYSGTYGTNGFHLDFSDNSSTSALGTDSSGNSNNFSVTGFSVASGAGNDSLIDTPMNYTPDSGNAGGNYCTLNPLDRQSTNGTLSNGNLDITQSPSAWAMYRSTMFVSSGKWYWELTIGNNQYTTIGICTDVYQMASSTGNWVNGSSEMFGYYPYNGKKYNGGTNAAYATADTTASGSVIGVALDMDNGTLAFYKDGTSLGTAYTGLTGKNVSPTHWLYEGSNADSYNFGQRPFVYTNAGTDRPAATFLSLCTQNFDDPTIADGSTAMDVLTYDGTNNIGHAVTGLSFAPDFVWIKCRSTGTTDHVLGNKINEGSHLASNTTDTETTGLIQSLDSTGFSLASNSGRTNQSGRTYVGWCWDAGTTTDTNNTDGSIASSVRANASAGFSIVSWTGNGTSGSTVGHGLNAAPKMIIFKNRDTAGTNWRVYNTMVDGSLDWVYLNTTAAKSDSGLSLPTSTTFTAGGSADTNGNGNAMLNLCFSPVEGYSAFGSYTGNGSADGPFVYTGFRPKWILLKRSDGGTENWTLWDTERNTFNVMGRQLYPNLSAAEANAGTNPSFGILDSVSNGFKLRGSHSSFNSSGGTFIYACFCEHPFKTARAR